MRGQCVPAHDSLGTFESIDGAEIPCILGKDQAENMVLMIEKIEKQENYQKNLRCLQEATEELLNHMKGYDLSFRPMITDKNGDFCAEKLRALVDEMLSLWADELHKGKPIDPKTQKSEAEPYLAQRLELYRLYLSLVMRCSLYPGAYSDARNGAEKKERTDFAFLLEQAKWLSRCWCVTLGPKGRKNELMSGYDEHFGLHLYYPFHLFQTFSFEGLEYKYEDFALTPNWNTVWNRLDQLTNEGNMKRIYLRRLPSASLSRPQEPEGAFQEQEDGSDAAGNAKELPAEDGSGGAACAKELPAEDSLDGTGLAEELPLEAEYDAADPEENAEENAEDEVPDPDEDPDDAFLSYNAELWDYGEEQDADYWIAEAERMEEAESRRYAILSLIRNFEGLDEYLSDCDAFVKLFEEAKPEVLRDLYPELQEIVELYLARQETVPLSDIDKTLDVYSRLFDGALRQAKRYARGLQWNDL